MADSIGSVSLDLELDRRAYNNDIKSIASATKNSLMSSFKGIGKAALGFFAIKEIVAFSKACMDVASDLEEVQNVVDSTFTTMSESVNQFSKTATKNFGLSETATKKYMGTFGAMSKSFGFSEKSAYNMAEAITALTADVASFYNLSYDESYTKLKSIWTGETESLKDLGVVMTQTALDSYALANGYGKITSKMSEAEKVALRYAFVQDKLKIASGDFKRTNSGFANQIRVLKLNFESLKATIGKLLINVINPLLLNLNKALSKLNMFASSFEKLFNLNKDEIGNSIKVNTEQAGENIEDTTKSVKKLKNVLAGFDEINILSLEETEDEDVQSSVVPEIDGNLKDLNVNIDVDDSKFKDKLEKLTDFISVEIVPVLSNLWESAKSNLQKIKDELKQWFIISIKPNLDSNFFEILASLGVAGESIYNSLKIAWDKISQLGSPLKNWFATDFTELINSFLDLFTVAFTSVSNMVSLVLCDIFENIVPNILTSIVNDIVPVVTQLFTELAKTLEVIVKVISDIFMKVYSEAISPVLSLITKIFGEMCESIHKFWQNYGFVTFENIRKVILEIGESFNIFWSKIFKPIWDNIVQCLDWLWTKHLKPLLDNFLDFIGVVINCILKLINEYFKPLVDFLMKVLGPIFNTVFNAIVDVVGTAVSFVIDIISDIITVLKGVIQFITGVFTGDIDLAFEGVKNIFKGLINGIVSIFKGGINLIIDFLNFLIGGIASIINGIVSGVQALIPGGKDGSENYMSENVKKIPKLARGGIINQPTLALIGEAGKEAVMPLENNTGWIDELASKIALNIGNGNKESRKEAIYIDLVIGGTRFGKVCVDNINAYQRKLGKVVLEV